jgi:hypothetical protein
MQTPYNNCKPILYKIIRETQVAHIFYSDMKKCTQCKEIQTLETTLIKLSHIIRSKKRGSLLVPPPQDYDETLM